MSIGGYATQPSFKNPGYIPNNDGQAVIYPGMFGVVNNVKVRSDIENLVITSDVIIDFTSPKDSLDLLEKINKYDKSTALVSGTTGYKKED